MANVSTAGSPARVAVLAFDACDVDLIRDLARTGKLPNFNRLLATWASTEIRNPYGIFVNALWPTFFTAGSPARLNYHCWQTISSRTYERRLVTPRDITGEPFWRRLSAAGRRIAIIDVPHAGSAGPVNGLEIFEYGCHDRHFGFHTSSPELTREIAERFGLHSVFTVDPYSEWHLAPDDYVHRAGSVRTQIEEAALLQDMLTGLERKRQLSSSILSSGGWDLFISVFGESHAIGHQSWHLHDPAHPRYDSGIAGVIGDPLEKIYVALDRALGDHLALTGPDTTVLVLLSHGMGPHYDGTHLLEEVLSQLNLFHRRGFGGKGAIRYAKAAWSRIPKRWQGICAPALAYAIKTHVREIPLSPCSDWDIGPKRRAARRFFLSPNNSVYGGIRINLAGREPAGLVEPGAEYDTVCEQLARDLLQLINVETSEPVIRAVERTEDHYVRDSNDELPDLILEWNRHRPIETVWSAKTGIVHAPYPNWRTGDHRPAGHLFISGPEFVDSEALGEIFIGDLGPTICAMLGYKLTGVDGKPQENLLRNKSAVGSA